MSLLTTWVSNKNRTHGAKQSGNTNIDRLKKHHNLNTHSDRKQVSRDQLTRTKEPGSNTRGENSDATEVEAETGKQRHMTAYTKEHMANQGSKRNTHD